MSRAVEAKRDGFADSKQEIALFRFYASLKRLDNSPLTKVAENAHLSYAFLDRNQGYDVRDRKMTAPTMVSELIMFPESGMPSGEQDADGEYLVFPSSFRPCVVANYDALLGRSDVAIRADLVRTTDVLHQLQTPGMFLASERDVFNRALWREVQFLKHVDAPELPDDPRTTPREQLLRTLMGEERYLMDTGFTDFQQAADIWINAMTDDNPRSIRDKIRERLTFVRKEDQKRARRKDYGADEVEEMVEGLEAVVDSAKQELGRAKVRSILQVERDHPVCFQYRREEPVNRYAYGRYRFDRVRKLLSERDSTSARQQWAAHAMVVGVLIEEGGLKPSQLIGTKAANALVNS